MFSRTVKGRALVLGSVTAAVCLCTSCYSMRPSSGGGQTKAPDERRLAPSDIALPPGYKIEVVASGLTFPTGIAFDGEGRLHVIEAGYSYGEVWTTPRLVRVGQDGYLTTIATGETNGPWTGAVFRDGNFYVVEGGQVLGGRILRVSPGGELAVIVKDLPGMGDHHSNGPVIGPDGWLYFGQGTASNAGVVGEDNAKFGWLFRHPRFHDVPGGDITLAGHNFQSGNPLEPGSDTKVRTGAFQPFGTASSEGQTVAGRVPCTGSILKVSPDGTQLSLVAWGLRNPFGLAFSPDGKLFATENGYDDRGSRPVWGAADVLWKIEQGVWYGWPDFSAGMALTNRYFKPPGKPQPQFLLVQHPNAPPKPVASLGVHSSACGLDFSRNADFGYEGQAFVALFGDQAPEVGKVLHPVGFKVVRVDVASGNMEPFAENKGKVSGPASWLKTGGLERPVSVRFSPGGEALYIVDFGIMTLSAKGTKPQVKSGVIWKVTRSAE